MINNAQEIIVPKLKGLWHRYKVRLVKNVTRTRWEEDYELIENEGLFQEYLEMGTYASRIVPCLLLEVIVTAKRDVVSDVLRREAKGN